MLNFEWDKEIYFLLFTVLEIIQLYGLYHHEKQRQTRKKDMKGIYNIMVNDNDYLNKEFNFDNAIKNPYVKRLRKSITMNVDIEVLDYFKEQSSNIGIPYQTLINLYLLDCAKNNKELNITWQ